MRFPLCFYQSGFGLFNSFAIILQLVDKLNTDTEMDEVQEDFNEVTIV